MYIRALLIKLVMITAVLWIVLGLFYGVSFINVLITSVFITGVAYALDVFILPKMGNVYASITDFVLILFVIYLFGSYLYIEPIPLGTASFISALIISMGELFFHRYMKDEVFGKDPTVKDERGYFQRTELQAEFAEENDIEADVKKIKEKDR